MTRWPSRNDRKHEHRYGFVRSISSIAYAVIARGGLARRRLRTLKKAACFCYHNVVQDDLAGRIGDGPLHMGISTFVEQLEWIRHTFEVIPAAELARRVRAGSSLGGLATLTFDDAYQGVLDHALPRLRRLAIPATLFVVTSAATRPEAFWWDRLGGSGMLTEARRLQSIGDLEGDTDLIRHAFPEARLGDIDPVALPASWDALRAAVGGPITIGSHSVSHRNLAVLPREAMASELRASRASLADALGVPPDLVSYPYGRVSDELAREARAAGYAAGLALSFGTVAPGSDPFRLIRINVPGALPTDTLECWVAGIRWNPPR